MLFGDKTTFALECDVEHFEIPSKNYRFGYIAAWIAGDLIGNSSEIVVLGIPVYHFKDSLKECGNRRDSSLSTKNAQEIWNFLESVLWGDLGDKELHEIHEDSRRYSKFSLFANFSEAFDGDNGYLIEIDDGEQFVWKTFHSDEIKSVILPLGTYQRVIESFLEWYDSLVCSY